MLKIEKIKDEIKNFDTNVNVDKVLSCWLHRITTNFNDNNNICGVVTCSECLRLSLMDLLEEYKEPVKLTRFEYEYLKVAKENEYNFIARDEDGGLFLYSIKPWKGEIAWKYRDSGIRIFTKMFDFVRWQDEEPYSVDEILANCEVMEDE